MAMGLRGLCCRFAGNSNLLRREKVLGRGGRGDRVCGCLMAGSTRAGEVVVGVLMGVNMIVGRGNGLRKRNRFCRGFESADCYRIFELSVAKAC